MLSRTETLLELIDLRKKIQSKEKKLNDGFTYHSDIKDHIDNLIYKIVGLPKENRYIINEILNKVINNEISTKTAVVAIHEIYKEFNDINKNQNKKKSQKRKENNYNVRKLYKNGYR